MKTAAAIGPLAGEFDALTAQVHAIRQPQGGGHRPHRLHLATHRIHQGQLGRGQGNGDGQAREAPAGTHIDHLQRPLCPRGRGWGRRC